MADAFRTIIAALVLTVILLTGTVVVDSVISARDAADGRIERDAAVFGADYGGDFVAVNDIAGRNETVYKTTGYAVTLTGANDSEITSDAGVNLGNDTSWHLSVWGGVDAASNDTAMKLASISGGEVIVWFNGSESPKQWYAWYYDQSSRNSYQVSVDASGNETGNLTNIQVKANDTALTIYRQTRGGAVQQGGVADLTVSNSVDAPTQAGNWDGRVEELRTYAEPLDSTNRSELRQSPVEQQPTLDRTSRIMFDNPHDQDVLILFVNANGDATNATFTKDGFSEQVMDANTATNDASGDTDYEFKREGPSVRVASSLFGTSELDGAPVAYVSYDAAPVGVALTELTAWIGVAGLLPVVLIMGPLLLVVLRLRD